MHHRQGSLGNNQMQGLYIQNNVTFQSTKVCRFSF
uniref:Uncharacterized protein n=1 Tax=Anguilla anguilla TaxID=7936 RepID=A0A0E9R8N7_ANGAN